MKIKILGKIHWLKINITKKKFTIETRIALEVHLVLCKINIHIILHGAWSIEYK